MPRSAKGKQGENRRELNEQLESQNVSIETGGGYAGNDFDFDEDTFLPNMDE